MGYSATIDVPDLVAGVAFYGGLLGWEEVARPVPVYAILSDGTARLGLMQKAAGSRPTPADGPVRDYARHWTPVHLDFEVADFETALGRIAALGGAVEARHEVPGRPPVAFCADPFGNGFCLLAARSRAGAG